MLQTVHVLLCKVRLTKIYFWKPVTADNGSHHIVIAKLVNFVKNIARRFPDARKSQSLGSRRALPQHGTCLYM